MNQSRSSMITNDFLILKHGLLLSSYKNSVKASGLTSQLSSQVKMEASSDSLPHQSVLGRRFVRQNLTIHYNRTVRIQHQLHVMVIMIIPLIQLIQEVHNFRIIALILFALAHLTG